MMNPRESQRPGLAGCRTTFTPATRAAILARWPDTFNDPYDFLDPLALRPNDAAAVLQAARELCAVYSRVAALVPLLPDSALLDLGVPESMLEVVRLPGDGKAPTFLGRFDLVKTRHGYSMFEFNSDNPGLLDQFVVLESELARQTGQSDLSCFLPAALDRALQALIASARQRLAKRVDDECFIACTAACADGNEIARAAFLCERLRRVPGCRCEFVPAAALEISDVEILDPAGRRIDVLYRLYPLDLFFRSLVRGRSGPSAVGRITRLIRDRKVIVVNPPGSFVLESKVLQAAIWGFRENGEYFSTEERAIIRRRFLPTYLDDVFDRSGYVVKPAFGRGGDSVTIVEPGTRRAIGNGTCTYADQTLVYQRYQASPKIVMSTENGEQELSAVTSCFVFNGAPAGVCIRVGCGVTDDGWWLVPTWSLGI
jgi:glutathionylspermidine synthase